MDLQEVLHMTAGDADTSYANNSNVQGEAIAKARPVVQHAVDELFFTMHPGAQQLAVADLGCSFGPNALAVISEVMDSVAMSCRKLRRYPLPEVQFYLNDLPANDFNSVFRSLASYKKRVKEEKGEELAGRFFVAAVAGSFHGRLFPSRSIHLFHASSSVHWLSQAPEGLKDKQNNEYLNKGNVYVGTTSPPCVHQAYLRQFQADFSTFLGCRSVELQDGGLMVLTIILNSSSIFFIDLMTEALMSMAHEGIIKEADIDAFNLPLYNPSIEEVRGVITDQGAFQIVHESVIESSWDGPLERDATTGKFPSDDKRGRTAAGVLRGSMGPLYERLIGEENVDLMFTSFARNLTREFGKGEQFPCCFYVVALKSKNST